MTKGLIAGGLTLAATFALYGCEGADPVEERVSAVCTAGRFSSDTSGVRGMVLGDGTHAAVFREVDASSITKETGMPLANPVNLGGNVMHGFTPSPYHRHDGRDVVLYVDVNAHIHELALPAGPDTDLTVYAGINAPAAAVGEHPDDVPDVLGYIRADNRSAFVYRRGSDDHVIEVVSNFSSQPPWLVNDLTALSGASVTASHHSVFPYVRSDGTNSIVYVANDFDIHELTGTGSPIGWQDWDLHHYSGETHGPGSGPWGYKRGDGVNSVVFIGFDGKLHEMYLQGFTWSAGILPAVQPAFFRPSGYVRPASGSGINAVAYLGLDNSVHEVELLPGGWTDVVLPQPTCVWPTGPIFAHANQGNASLLFQGWSFPNGSGNPGVSRRYELSAPAQTGVWTLYRL